jgi:hypothetical protein
MDISFILLISIFAVIFLTPACLYVKANRVRWLHELDLLWNGDPDAVVKLEARGPKTRSGKPQSFEKKAKSKKKKDKINPETTDVQTPGSVQQASAARPAYIGGPRPKPSSPQKMAGPGVNLVQQARPQAANRPLSVKRARANANPKANPSKSSFLKDREKATKQKRQKIRGLK